MRARRSGSKPASAGSISTSEHGGIFADGTMVCAPIDRRRDRMRALLLGLDRPGGASRRWRGRGHGGVARGLGDLRRGRPLGGQHERLAVAHRRARPDRVLRQRGTGEAIPGCHRSKSAEVHIGGGVKSVNLACSGARTYSRVSDGKFKPGIDFYNVGGNKGQALALQELATARQGHQGRRRADRRQRLRLRRHRPDVRDRLADVAVVVEELLPGRLEHHRDVLGVEHRQGHQRRARRVHRASSRR